MSEVKVNKISPRTACGTVTLGDSGDTFTIPSGVTLTNSGTATGFGATGAVSWNTTKITADPGPAVTGTGYFCDTSSGAFTITLPAGVAGSIIAVADYTRTFNTNNLTISPNGAEKIGGVAQDATLSVDGQSATFVYVDGTEGWINTQETQTSQTGVVPVYITATGGNQPTSTGCIVDTNYKQHTFTSPGTFCISAAAGPLAVLDYMVIAGGGGGGSYGGGAGAGGYRESHVVATSGPYTASPLASTCSLTVTPGGIPITIGAGGTGASTPGPANPVGTQGTPTVFSSITSTGGGGGGSGPTSGFAGGAGGSGGGAGPGVSCGTGAVGAGNTPPVSPPQGNNGGSAWHYPGLYQLGGGGGGAGAVGVSAPTGGPTGVKGGCGGAGVTTNINGSPVVRAGGGGGGSDNAPRPGGSGGSGGGGAGGLEPVPAVAGTVNTGGGGGGGRGGPPGRCGGDGGSGIVIIRYKFQ